MISLFTSIYVSAQIALAHIFSEFNTKDFG